MGMNMNFEQVTPTIVLDIRSKMQDFNPAQKAVANYILSNFYDMEGMPIRDLAVKSEVSEATVSRFVKAMGYENYRAFQLEVTKNKAERRKGSLKGYAEVTEEDNALGICRKIFESNIQALQDTLTVIDYDALERAADLIVRARRLCIFAQGRSKVTANSIRLRLHRLGIEGTLYTDPHEQAIASSLMGPEDVAVGISTFGRSRSILVSIRRAAARGSSIIGVTSYQNTPLEKEADILLRTVNNDEADFGSEPSCASVTQMVMLDCLYMLVAKRMEGKAEEPFKITRDAIQQEKE